MLALDAEAREGASYGLGDDPMLEGTGFGGRGKGEGNKTCYSWISAVTIWAHQELLARYGTDDIRSINSGHTKKRGLRHE
jgi:hypothetical protein